MARKQLEPCMFCDEPHTGNCGGTPPKPKARPALSSVKRASPTPKTAPAPSSQVEPEPSKPTPNLASLERVRSRDDEQLAYAVTLFAERDMLHHETLSEHRDLIRLPAHKINTMIWKQVNKGVVQKRLST